MEIDTNDIIIGALTNIVEDSVLGAWEKAKKFFKDLNEKDSIKYGVAYEKYLENTKSKNSKIKTLIYRHSPRNLYSFYECIGVRYNGKIIDTCNINNLIEINKKIIVSGTGGIGKTTLLKHLFLNTIEETSFIPVLIELRSFNILDNKEISLFDAIYKNLCDNGLCLEKEYFEYSMKEGGYVILLDGYDEISSEKVKKISKAIIEISNKYNNNHFIISSRPTEEFIGWNDFAEVHSCILSKEQALSLIKKIDFDEKIKDVFYNELNNGLYDKYKSFASNPLLLTIMLLTFENRAAIPDKLNDFYEQAFSALFNMHDATKDAYVRDISSELGCEDFKSVFSYICFKSFFADEYEFTESRLQKYIKDARDKFKNINFDIEAFQEDLIKSVCMIIKDGLKYRFSHRSFQEYFAAVYTCKLTDDIQNKLLSNWIKESDFIKIESYFTMLFNLQGEKVNKIIFLPAIIQMEELYNKYGFSVDFLKKVFDGIAVRTNKKKKGESISLRIKDQYLCYNLMLAVKLNNYKTLGKSNNSNNSNIAKILRRNTNTNNWTFDEALAIVSEEEILKEVDWLESQLKFAIQILRDNESQSINRKRKVSSILDEL
ncbi:NACHT domain-containing protein [Clostridium perfringens]|uniref:NACHT domain-containing protein n=1 Tax=Clostridium perfringens TaxID=1502 RepID=UPI0024BCA511|nr:NACHT domain-containing protein [Clostridium perfringens]MDU2085983.1 NACHT domain-containing protein [Clostridium perfringens]MDU8977380.1 NACHT domain-containing protein [Clostridium perfringens]